jgi:hypothetical protein
MPRLRLPSPFETILALSAALVFFVALSARRGQRIAVLETTLAAKPRIEFRDRIVEKRVDVKGPVHIVKVEALDGSKTTTVDRSPETVTTDKNRDTAHTETPVCPPPGAQKTRWGHVTLDPERLPNPDAVRRVAGGWTLWDTLDLGGSYDWRFGAFGLEVGARF